MNKYNLVVFDLDGTLFDSDLALVKIAFKMSEKFLFRKNVNIDDLLYINGPSLDESLPFLFPDYPIEDLRKEYYKHAMTTSLDITMFPQVTKMLKDLEALNIKMAVFTSRARISAVHLLKQHGIHDRFVKIVCGDDGFTKKPSGEGLDHIIKELKFSKEDTLFVGDNWRDILAGADVGVDVAILKPYRRIHKVDAKAKIVINDLSEIVEVVKK